MEPYRAVVLIEVWGGSARGHSEETNLAAELDRTETIRETLSSLSEVSARGTYFRVLGQSDVVAILEGDSMKEIYETVLKIRRLPMIKLTTTLPVMQSSLPVVRSD